MADTKQATPDDKQNDIALFSAEHDFGNAKYFYAARTAIAELKRLLASRSGPERTLSAKEFFRNDPRFRNTNTEPYTDVELAHVNTSINGTDVFEFAEAYASQAGPDRATQDEEDEHSAAAVAATAYQICGVLRAPTRIMDYFSAIAQSELWPANPLPFSPDEWKPDRGQQDAPGVEVDGIGRFSIMLKKGETLTDIADELTHVAEQAVMPPLETHVEALQITMKFAADKLRQFMAKAAREGQDATQMLLRIRATLQSRAEGHNTGGDIEVMKAVDAIVRREARWEGEPWEAPKGKST